MGDSVKLGKWLNVTLANFKCDQMVRLFFNIWPFVTLKMCCHSLEKFPWYVQNVAKCVTNSKKCPRKFKILAKWRNFN